MDAALNLDLDTQSVIFHLVHEPMTQVSMGQNLARECVLAGFKGPNGKQDSRAIMHQSTLAVLDTANNEVSNFSLYPWCSYATTSTIRVFLLVFQPSVVSR